MSLVPLADSSDLANYRSRDANSILRQVSAAVRAYCHWHIAPVQSETWTLDGSGTRFLWLPTLRVVSIESITNNGVAVDLTTVDTSKSGYLVLRCDVSSALHCWSHRPGGIVIQLHHGLDDIPDELVELTMAVALRAVSSPTGIVREQAGAVSAEYALVAPGVSGGIAFLQHEKALLAPYRLAQRF